MKAVNVRQGKIIKKVVYTPKDETVEIVKYIFSSYIKESEIINDREVQFPESQIIMLDWMEVSEEAKIKAKYGARNAVAHFTPGTTTRTAITPYALAGRYEEAIQGNKTKSPKALIEACAEHDKKEGFAHSWFFNMVLDQGLFPESPFLLKPSFLARCKKFLLRFIPQINKLEKSA